MVNCDFEGYRDFYTRNELGSEASGGDGGHPTDCLFMPESSALSEYNQTLAAFESVNRLTLNFSLAFNFHSKVAFTLFRSEYFFSTNLV